jgi:hypothetical protein
MRLSCTIAVCVCVLIATRSCNLYITAAGGDLEDSAVNAAVNAIALGAHVKAELTAAAAGRTAVHSSCDDKSIADDMSEGKLHAVVHCSVHHWCCITFKCVLL